MVKIQSSIGEGGFQASGRNFVVEDESPQRSPRQRPLAQDQISQDRQINPAVAAGLRRQAMEQQQLQEQRSLVDAKRRIEILTGIGRNTKDVEVGGIVFTLRSLKTFEQNSLDHVVAAQKQVRLPNGSSSFTPIGMNEIKLEALSHALFMIDGQSVDVVLGTINEEYDIQVSARKDLVNEMDGTLVDYLFVQYQGLVKETQDGYAPKTSEEVREVVDAMRKSGEDA